MKTNLYRAKGDTRGKGKFCDANRHLLYAVGFRSENNVKLKRIIPCGWSPPSQSFSPMIHQK